MTNNDEKRRGTTVRDGGGGNESAGREREDESVNEKVSAEFSKTGDTIAVPQYNRGRIHKPPWSWLQARWYLPTKFHLKIIYVPTTTVLETTAVVSLCSISFLIFVCLTTVVPAPTVVVSPTTFNF